MNATLQTQIKATPTSSFTPVQGRLLQRKCACGGTPGPTGECEACRKKREAATLQRAASHAAVVNAVPPIVHDVLRSPGQPLDSATRAFMEPRFGHDFSQVRVHTDATAAESAQAVNALAYTVGRDVVFGAGQFAPGMMEGKRLLAHELTHVVQQSQQSLNSSTRSTPKLSNLAGYEYEATEVSHHILMNRVPTTIATGGTPWLQCQEQRGRSQQRPTEAKPKLKYKTAERENKRLAEPNTLGWGTKLETVAGGAYKAWADLWKSGQYDTFADTVAAYQISIGTSRKSVDGVLGLQTWSKIAGYGEAIAGIQKVIHSRSDEVCTLASKERIERGYKLATGEKFALPEDKDRTTFNVILQSIEGRMHEIDEQYRGTGAAGAMIYLGLGTFVSESSIWSGGLRPGAVLQVWRYRKAYELMRAGKVEEKGGKTRPIRPTDADFFGTSYVFVRYHPKNPELLLVRHFGGSEWVNKSEWKVWIAANVTISDKSQTDSNK